MAWWGWGLERAVQPSSVLLRLLQGKENDGFAFALVWGVRCAICMH